MAKEGPTFIDKHIEKVVLAVALAVFGYCVITWGIGTPRRVQIGKAQVKPEQVDSKILNDATSLQRRINAVVYKGARFPDWGQELRSWQRSPLRLTSWKTVTDRDSGEKVTKKIGTQRVLLASANMAPPYALGLLRKEPEGVKKTTPEELVAAMPKPGKPNVTCELVITPIKEGTGRNQVTRAEEAIRLTAATRHDLAAMQGAWDKILEGTVANAKFIKPYGCEVQYQVRGEDGTWVDVPDMKGERRDRDGVVHTASVPVIPEYTGENAGDILKGIDEHLRNGWTVWLMQPYAADVLVSGEGRKWQDSLFPWSVMENYPPDPSKVKSGSQAPGGAKAPTMAPGAGRAPTPAAPMGPGEMGPMEGEPGMTPGGPGSDETYGNENRKLPTLAVQIRRKNLLMWSHESGLKFGRDYRVRFRMVYFSPLLTVDDAVKQPEMAKVQLLKSPWSDWSDAVRVDREMRYYVTGFSPVGNKAVTLTVFTKKYGSWVRKDFEKLTPGMAIGGVAQVKVYNPCAKEIETVDVDFSTGATLLELTTKQTYFRGGRDYPDGVAVVIRDANGKLVRRVKNVDTEDPEYIQLRDDTKEIRFRQPATTGGRPPAPIDGEEGMGPLAPL